MVAPFGSGFVVCGWLINYALLRLDNRGLDARRCHKPQSQTPDRSLSNTGGGTVNIATNVVFGTMAGVRPDGSVVYPAYTIAHEFGHTYQATDRNHPSWQVSSLTMTSEQRQIAPTSAEFYAYHFAEQVSREVRENAGVNIGTQSKYSDVGSSSQSRGIWP